MLGCASCAMLHSAVKLFVSKVRKVQWACKASLTWCTQASQCSLMPVTPRTISIMYFSCTQVERACRSCAAGGAVHWHTEDSASHYQAHAVA